jgi:hypothetical protein
VCVAIPVSPEPEQEIEESQDLGSPPKGEGDDTENDLREVPV